MRYVTSISDKKDKLKRAAHKKKRCEQDTDSSSSTISASAIRNIVDKLKLQGRRSSTRRIYYTIWKLFNNFFICLDVKPDTWEDRLILFTGYLIENEKKSTMVKSYISAIKAVLREDGVIINEDRCLINSLTKACRYQNDRVRTYLPIGRDLMKLLLKKIDLVFPSQQPYLTTLYKAILSTAYFGLFRVGELTDSPHVMKTKDVNIGMNKNKLMFVLRTSKTHWKDVPLQIVKISSVAVEQDAKVEWVSFPITEGLCNPEELSFNGR